MSTIKERGIKYHTQSWLKLRYIYIWWYIWLNKKVEKDLACEIPIPRAMGNGPKLIEPLFPPHKHLIWCYHLSK